MQLSRWSLEENTADEEVIYNICIISDNNYKKTWSRIRLLHEVLHSPTSDFKNSAEEFPTSRSKKKTKLKYINTLK
ncbi:hypothetical protein Hanom_Chr08g00724871 [Helianthus anomalus]